MYNSSIGPKHWTLSSVTTPGQSGPESDGNEGALLIHQSPCITGTPSSDSVISKTHVGGWDITPLQICYRCIVQSQPIGLCLYNSIISLFVHISLSKYIHCAGIVYKELTSILIQVFCIVLYINKFGDRS